MNYTSRFLKLPIESVKQVYCHSNFTLFLLNNGKIIGYGHLERLGLESLSRTSFGPQELPIDSVKEIIAGNRGTFFQKEDGIWAFNKNNNYLATKFTSLIKVFVGINNIFCLHESGVVLGFGRNDKGQLGLGHTNPTAEPTKVSIKSGEVVEVIPGVDHTLFLLKDGRIFGCGSNQYGQLSLGAEFKKVLVPQELPALTECFGLHALYKEIESMASANISKQESNSSESRKNIR